MGTVLVASVVAGLVVGASVVVDARGVAGGSVASGVVGVAVVASCVVDAGVCGAWVVVVKVVGACVVVEIAVVAPVVELCSGSGAARFSINRFMPLLGCSAPALLTRLIEASVVCSVLACCSVAVVETGFSEALVVSVVMGTAFVVVAWVTVFAVVTVVAGALVLSSCEPSFGTR